jgi:poly(hydroxyalkanoate) depolymerase family esterase
LHGCRQNAADFAAGTQIDRYADRYGVTVLYPEQNERANGRRCWNWFLPAHQSRAAGEPAAILELVDAVVRRHDIDRERIFVCGLSAGAAMAAILAEQAPDVFSAVGLMAGVALHSSHDVDSAFTAMRGEPDGARLPIVARDDVVYDRLRVIAWTGARDTTVVPANAMILAQQFSDLLRLPITPTRFEQLPDGTRATWFDGTEKRRMEVRAIENLGHAWSGGSFRGSFTNPRTTNATEAMMTFFLEDDRLGLHAPFRGEHRADVMPLTRRTSRER